MPRTPAVNKRAPRRVILTNAHVSRAARRRSARAVRPRSGRPRAGLRRPSRLAIGQVVAVRHVPTGPRPDRGPGEPDRRSLSVDEAGASGQQEGP